MGRGERWLPRASGSTHGFFTYHLPLTTKLDVKRQAAAHAVFLTDHSPLSTDTMERAAYSSTKDRLTQGTFDILLSRLNPDRERAGGVYAGLRTKLARFFTLHADYAAEDAADETLDRVARKLAEGATAENIEQYAYNVARHILFEREKRERRTKAAFDHSIADGHHVTHKDPEPEDPTDHYQAMADCLSHLPEVDQKLLREYYSDKTNAPQRALLSVSLNVSVKQLRLRVFRLRARLSECLRKKRAAHYK